jgi:BlaI family transcriptional regulator, penicillinase repressor
MAEQPVGPLTQAEWKVMKIIWRRRECAARDVCEEAARQFTWAPTTTKTVLRRLVDKGYLVAIRVGNSFLYRPARSHVKTMLSAADSLLEHLLEGATGPVLAHLVQKSNLTPEELEKLTALIAAQTDQRKKKTRLKGKEG